jgi:hypothetical protein
MRRLAGIVLKEKYDRLISKVPKAAAEVVGEVEKRNYLAHSIREIEYAILQYASKNYHIITRSAEYSKKARIEFFDKGCIIWLPEGNEEMMDEEVRLVLAHELGHLVYNIGRLFNPEILMIPHCSYLTVSSAHHPISIKPLLFPPKSFFNIK